MAGSLQDQLLKIGVIDKQQSKKAKHQQRKQGNKTRQAIKSGKTVESESAVVQQQLDQERHNKKNRDLELNKQRDAERTDKAVVAEVMQIIQQHNVAIPKEADVAYNFTHDKKVKKIYVSSEQQKQLTLGQLAIATLDEKNSLIPDKIAEKIEARLPSSVTRIPSETTSNEDDPYADYQIPDDLMW
jgi:uncharacterized protein YaiL (DUF2058 family)